MLCVQVSGLRARLRLTHTGLGRVTLWLSSYFDQLSENTHPEAKEWTQPVWTGVPVRARLETLPGEGEGEEEWFLAAPRRCLPAAAGPVSPAAGGWAAWAFPLPPQLGRRNVSSDVRAGPWLASKIAVRALGSVLG